MSKNIKIFIADDHPLLLKGLNEELLINGYNVVGTTVTGTEALKLIIKLKPDIAILDIQMPGISGFEVIKKSKIKNPVSFIKDFQTKWKISEKWSQALAKQND